MGIFGSNSKGIAEKVSKEIAEEILPKESPKMLPAKNHMEFAGGIS